MYLPYLFVFTFMLFPIIVLSAVFIWFSNSHHRVATAQTGRSVEV